MRGGRLDRKWSSATEYSCLGWSASDTRTAKSHTLLFTGSMLIKRSTWGDSRPSRFSKESATYFFRSCQVYLGFCEIGVLPFRPFGFLHQTIDTALVSFIVELRLIFSERHRPGAFALTFLSSRFLMTFLRGCIWSLASIAGFRILTSTIFTSSSKSVLNSS